MFILKEDEDKMAEITGFRVKYQEAGGDILTNFFDKNLASGKHCGRSECPTCVQPEGNVNCKARNIIYESKCLVCNPPSSHLEDRDDAVQPSGLDISTQNSTENSTGQSDEVSTRNPTNNSTQNSTGYSTRVPTTYPTLKPSQMSTRNGVYVGETSRSLYERALEHVRDGKTFSVKSHITKH